MTTSAHTTAKCPMPPTPAMKAAIHHCAGKASPPPLNNATASPLWKLHHLQQLPPSHSPLSLTMSRTQTVTMGPLPALSTSPRTTTWQSL
jgi:hypothetical protein